MKKALQFFLLWTMAQPLFAQLSQSELTQSIKGTVVDKQSQATLPGVNVVLVGSNPVMGTATDIEGRFRLDKVPVGRQTVQISFMGYETVTIGNLLINSAKETEIKVELQESVTKLGEVVIKAQNDKRNAINSMSTVSARTFSVEEAARYSGSLQDPSKMAQNFAGVSGASDDRNDIIIRGNSPTGVLWRMEGIDIPSPNHFASLGSTGGPVSMLNINNLSNSDFMTGAWSANYGNALSGVFDLNLRNGNADKREYLAQVGFNGFEFGAEGPFRKSKPASYLLNYRYSTLGVFKALGVNLGTGAAIPQYQDITFKINLPTAKFGRFTLWGVGGTSFIEFKANPNDNSNLYSGRNQDSDFGSTTGIVGASHTLFFNPNTYQKLVVAASTAISNGMIDSVSSVDESRFRTAGFSRRQSKYSFNYKINHKLNAKHNMSAGIMGDYYSLDILDTLRLNSGMFRTITNISDGGMLFQSYLNWQWRPSDKLTVNTGLHSQHFLLSNAHIAEPRVGIKYALNPRHSFSLGAGLHSQMQPITVYFIQEIDANGKVTLPNRSLGFTKSSHFVLGYDYFINESLRLKSEVYYQYLFDIPVEQTPSSFSMINEGANFTLPTKTGLINNGTASNYGIELTLEKFFSKGYYFLLTNSIFQSQYKGSDGIERNTVFNGNFVLNALGGKEFKTGKKTSLSLDSKITWAGGRRFTPINLEQSVLFGTEIRNEAQAFSKQYADYFRFDFKITFRYNGKRTSQQFGVDLQNLTVQKNIFLEGFNASTGKVGYTYQRGFFPDVQYKLYF